MSELEMIKLHHLSISVKETSDFITEIIANYDIKKEINKISNGNTYMKVKQLDNTNKSVIHKKKNTPTYFTWCKCHLLQSFIDVKPNYCFNKNHKIPKKYRDTLRNILIDIKNRSVE